MSPESVLGFEIKTCAKSRTYSTSRESFFTRRAVDLLQCVCHPFATEAAVRQFALSRLTAIRLYERFVKGIEISALRRARLKVAVIGSGGATGSLFRAYLGTG